MGVLGCRVVPVPRLEVSAGRGAAAGLYLMPPRRSPPVCGRGLGVTCWHHLGLGPCPARCSAETRGRERRAWRREHCLWRAPAGPASGTQMKEPGRGQVQTVQGRRPEGWGEVPPSCPLELDSPLRLPARLLGSAQELGFAHVPGSPRETNQLAQWVPQPVP